jgi:hypothetical protein
MKLPRMPGADVNVCTLTCKPVAADGCMTIMSATASFRGMCKQPSCRAPAGSEARLERMLSRRAAVQGLRAPDRKQKYEKICFSKLSLGLGELCAGLPREFVHYFEYVRGLKFDEEPDYSHLRRLLRDLFVRKGLAWDHNYDWKARAAEAPAVVPAAAVTPAPRLLRAPQKETKLPPNSPDTTTEAELKTTQVGDEESPALPKSYIRRKASALLSRRKR